VPSALFEIPDPRGSRFWMAKNGGPCNFTFWPEEFYQEFFHDRVTDREGDALAVLRAVASCLYDEMQQDSLAGSDQRLSLAE